MADRDRFRVIDGDETPAPGRKRGRDREELLICPCGSATFIEARTHIKIRNGKLSGGTRQLFCLHCKRPATG